MRAVLLFLVAVAGFMMHACGGKAGAARPSDGTLVLEVGGGHASLRQALAAAGMTMAPPRLLTDPGDQPAPATNELPAKGAVRTAPPQQLPQPDERVVSVAPPEDQRPTDDSRVVVLRRGQTVIHLAKEHLGDGNRFREILTRNGWTEADARRLPEGTKVRVPIDSAQSGRGVR